MLNDSQGESMKGMQIVDSGLTGIDDASIELPRYANKIRRFQLFTISNSDAASKVFFSGHLLGSLFLAYIALFGFVSGAGVLSTLSGLLFLGATSLLSVHRGFRRSPLSILFCIFTFLYLSLPTAFILNQGRDYFFGTGLAELPFKQEDYRQSLPWGLVYLTASWVGVWLAIISVKTRRWRLDQNSFSTISIRRVLLLGVAVFFVTALDRMEFSDVYLSGVDREESLLTLLLFFHAYLPLAGLILIFKLNEISSLAPRKVSSAMAAILIGFSFLVTVGGSKAAILPVLIFLVVYPFSLFRAYPNALVAVPSMKLVSIVAILVLPIFFLVSVQRNLENEVAPNLAAVLEALGRLDASIIYELPKTVFYRFSQTGADRLLLVFQSFVVDGYSLGMAQEFVVYLTKNALNLLLPGTPFMEAYAPSSQLYPVVLAKGAMLGEMNLSTLMHSFNTQAYTIFGALTIVFGVAAPVALCLFACIFIFIFNRIQNLFVRMTMLYFFSEALACHGLEVVLANSAHVLVSAWFMYLLLRLKISLRKPLAKY